MLYALCGKGYKRRQRVGVMSTLIRIYIGIDIYYLYICLILYLFNKYIN